MSEHRVWACRLAYRVVLADSFLLTVLSFKLTEYGIKYTPDASGAPRPRVDHPRVTSVSIIAGLTLHRRAQRVVRI